MRGGDRRSSRKDECVAESFVRGREQFAAALRHCACSQRAAIAERERSPCYCDTADGVRLIERHGAGIDGERPHHVQRARVFLERGLRRAEGQRIRLVGGAELDRGQEKAIAGMRKFCNPSQTAATR